MERRDERPAAAPTPGTEFCRIVVPAGDSGDESNSRAYYSANETLCVESVDPDLDPSRVPIILCHINQTLHPHNPTDLLTSSLLPRYAAVVTTSANCATDPERSSPTSAPPPPSDDGRSTPSPWRSRWLDSPVVCLELTLASLSVALCVRDRWRRGRVNRRERKRAERREKSRAARIARAAVGRGEGTASIGSEERDKRILQKDLDLIRRLLRPSRPAPQRRRGRELLRLRGVAVDTGVVGERARDGKGDQQQQQEKKGDSFPPQPPPAYHLFPC